MVIERLFVFLSSPMASFFAVLLVQSCIVCLAISSSNITDQLSLLAFKSAITYDPTNVLRNNWTENSNLCNWFGVSCSRRRQRVTMLNLTGMGLQGPISPHIANLSFLVGLDLTNNSFHSSLPNDIGRLRRLRGLILQDNMLKGNIPPSLHQCQKLTVISLAGNQFSGGIPEELSTLPILRTLFLGRNNLTGTIPPSIGNASSLEWLGLEFNNIYGSIPPELGHLHSLIILSLGNNKLSGLIPPEIFNFSSISGISLTDNSLSRYLPPTTGFWLPNLQILYLGINQLSGNIPSHLSNSSMLVALDLSFNFFTGTIPTSFGQLQSIQILAMADNQLTGQIPQEIGAMKNLISLVLTINKLNGSIPSIIGGNERLQRLNLDVNELEGPIPNTICHLRNLGELILDYNKFLGAIPSCIDQIHNLQWMSLSSNALSSIPLAMWNLQSLIYLNLSFNSIGGILEPNIRSLKLMEHMDLSFNQISGNIPSTIGDFQSLISLNLSRNSFSGPIPETFGKLITLNFFDLSHNNLSGPIPKSLESLSHLHYLNFSFNSLSGEIPTGGSFANLTAQSFLPNRDLCGKPVSQSQPCGHHISKNSRTKSLFLKFILPPIALVLIIAFLSCVLKRYRRNGIQSQHSNVILAQVEHRFISYHELRNATNGFCEANLLGTGSMGSVYKGILLDGTNVAVKVLNLQHEGAFKCFDAECAVLRTALHRNLVKIISTCSNPDLRALVLRYMSNGSLEKWLYSFNYCLNLIQRVNNMLDVALALEYLHCGLLEPVVHCDLKPSNVLLDEDMVAHVGDFGIAKILAENKTATQTKTLGTLGYIAPEYGSEGRVSVKGDIYSYGIMLLETFTRKKPTDEMFTGEVGLSQWVKASLPIRIMDVIDNALITNDGGNMKVIQDNLVAIMELGLECSKESPEERNDIKEVIAKLNKIKTQILSNNGAWH